MSNVWIWGKGFVRVPRLREVKPPMQELLKQSAEGGAAGVYHALS
jgi:hypothetical protein